MKELERLLSGDATNFERELLESVMREQPSAQLKLQMQQNLGFTGPSLWLTSAKAALSTATGKGAAAVLGVTLIGGAGVGLSALPGVPGLDESRDAVEATTAPASMTPAPAVVTAEPLPSATSQLREEIRLLDAVRNAVERGKRQQASSLLATYDEQFPRGTLRREAAILKSRNQRR